MHARLVVKDQARPWNKGLLIDQKMPVQRTRRHRLVPVVIGTVTIISICFLAPTPPFFWASLRCAGRAERLGRADRADNPAQGLLLRSACIQAALRSLPPQPS